MKYYRLVKVTELIKGSVSVCNAFYSGIKRCLQIKQTGKI